MTDHVILVDAQDKELGTMEKMQAHREGLLHRAFSVFVFNRDGKIMLQRRASHKYHSAGLWTNTCCSHPRSGETVEEAADRRLVEEMGMNCNLDRAFHFVYRSELDSGLIEHELDHVLIGFHEDAPKPNPEEVSEWKWMLPSDITRDMAENPNSYTEWFKICFEQVISHFQKHHAA